MNASWITCTVPFFMPKQVTTPLWSATTIYNRRKIKFCKKWQKFILTMHLEKLSMTKVSLKKKWWHQKKPIPTFCTALFPPAGRIFMHFGDVTPTFIINSEVNNEK